MTWMAGKPFLAYFEQVAALSTTKKNFSGLRPLWESDEPYLPLCWVDTLVTERPEQTHSVVFLLGCCAATCLITAVQSGT